MKKWAIPGAILFIIIIIAAWVIGSYNGMVSATQDVNNQWSQVQNVYQRRADLIPNLVATVKGYAAHEKSTLTDVVKARSSALAQQVNVNGIPSQEQLNKFANAQSSLGSALGRLMVVVERYPDLKANQNFLALQNELAGTENRITVERQRFNDAVKNYNIRIQRFPGNLMARSFGFTAKAYFKANAQAENVPHVTF